MPAIVRRLIRSFSVSPRPRVHPLLERRLVALAGFAILGMLPRAACAAPSLEWIFPAGGQRGTTITLAVAGDDLAQVAGLFSSGTGLKAQLLPATEPLPPALETRKKGEKPAAPEAKKYRQFRVTIAPDAPLGRQEVRVFDATGVSNARYFQVGDQREVIEQEPNDDSQGQSVDPPVVVNGRIQQSTDVDVYSFRGKKGERIVGEVYGERVLGTIDDSWLKGYLELRDGAGHVLASSEGYYHWDPLIEYTLPADGDYSFAFRDLMYRGSASAVYRLGIGALPRATALVPSGGRRGSTVSVTFVGDNLGPHPVRAITIPADAPLGVQKVRFQTPSGWTNPLPFQVSDQPEVRELDPKDDPQHAKPVTPPVTINGRLEQPGDRGNFRFKLSKGQRLNLEIWADRGESPMDSFLRVLDKDGKSVEEDDDGIHEHDVEVHSRDSRIERNFDEGEYIAQVRDLDERGGDSFVYRLSIAPPQPDYSLTVTPDRPAIGAGGTAELDVSVDRTEGFEGDVTVRATDLPPGLTASTAVIPKGKDKGVLTVTAAENLPVQPLLLHVYGEATIDGRRERRLAEATETYNIQGTGFTRYLIGPVAGIGALAPLALSTEPQTLSLKGGEKTTVRVKLQRRPAASGEVKVQLTHLPEGVKAEPVKVAGGAAEATLQLQAEQDVAAAAVNLVATGETKVGDSSVTETSPALALTVTEVPGFVLAVDPNELKLDPASKDEPSVTAKVQRRGGFDGPIDLEWSIPTAKLTFPAGRIDAGHSEMKVTLKPPKSLPAGDVDVKLIARATIGGETRSRDTSLKLSVTAAPAGAK